MTTIIASAISVETAEQCITDIRSGLKTAKKAVYDLWAKQGWCVLKNANGEFYSSFRECIRDRFQQSESYIYRLKDVALVEAALKSKTGTTHTLLASHVRELKKLPNIEDKAEALNIAQSIANVTNRDLTAKHVEKGVLLVAARKRIERSGHAVIKLAYENNSLSTEEADALILALDRESAQAQLTIQELMVQYGTFKDANLIPLLARDIARENTADPSRVFQWVKEGHVMDVPLKQATAADYKRAKQEARRIREAEEEARQNAERRKAGLPIVEKILCTVYKGDAEKTAKALKDLLGEDECRALVAALTQNAPLEGAPANR